MDMITRDEILSRIEKYIAETGMGPSYFSVVSTGSASTVTRMRAGSDISMNTAAKILTFLKKYPADKGGYKKRGKPPKGKSEYPHSKVR